MNRTYNSHRNLISFGVPLILFGILILFMRYSLPRGNDILEVAITIDLLIIVPLVYFMLIRKSKIPKTTVIPIIVIGLLIGLYFLPTRNHYYLNLFKTWLLPLIEVSILILVIIKVRNALKKFKSIKESSPDFFHALRSSCYEILPKKLALPFATEVAVIYYGFIHWRTREIRENEFTYHKKSGTPALFGAFIFIIGIETVALHLLIARWNPLVAWLLTALSLYAAIQVFGFAKSLSKRPITINIKSLTLKFGILNEVEICISDIDAIELSGKPLDKDVLTKTLSPLGVLESHNVIIHLKEEYEIIGLYGTKKKFKTIGLHIDEPRDFKETINKVLLTSREH